MRSLVITSVAALAALAAAGSIAPASAGVVDFNFDAPGGNLGLTQTYSTGNPLLSIIATAEAGGADLYGKNTGPGEQGLGLTNDPTGDNEISAGHGYIQLDVSGLFGKVGSLTTMFGTNSVTGTDTWALYGSNTSGTLGSLLSTASTMGTDLLPSFGTYKYYDFAATSGNYLIADVTATQVPEPASMALLGMGLVGLGAIRRARKGSKSA